MTGNSSRTSVLIVSAYASVRAGLRAFLDSAADITVVAEVSGSAELQRLLPEARPEVLLVDDLPDDRRRLLGQAAEGEIALVLLGDSRDGYSVLTDVPLPGWAYLLKEADGQEIVGAIHAAAAGLIALDRSLTPWPAAPIGAKGAAQDALTLREREVLALLARGLPNKQIAARLAISLHTVKFHVASILAKLGAASRTEAVMLGARQGAVSL